jgi:NTE family protein
MALSATDAAVDATARLAADAFGRFLRDWEDGVIAFRCSLRPEEVQQLGGPADWRCDDVRFSLTFVSIDRLDEPELRAALEAMPTRLSLAPEQVDTALQAGREATFASPRVHRYLHDRIGPVLQTAGAP